MNYTKGDWEIVYRDDEQHMCMTVIAPKGTMGDTSNICRLCDDPNQDKVIAIVLHQIRPLAGIDAIDRSEDEGNAALMVNAARMYEALLICSEYLKKYPDKHYTYEEVTEAVSKALAEVEKTEV